jgi:hypothetical protein
MLPCSYERRIAGVALPCLAVNAADTQNRTSLSSPDDVSYV